MFVHTLQPTFLGVSGDIQSQVCMGEGEGKSSLLRGGPLSFRTLPGVRTESLEGHPPLTLHDTIPEFPEAPKMADLPMVAMHLCPHWYLSPSIVRRVDD